MHSNGVLTCGAFFSNLLHVKQNNRNCARPPKLNIFAKQYRHMRLETVTDPEETAMLVKPLFHGNLCLHLMLSQSAHNFLLSCLSAKAKADSELIPAKAEVKGMTGTSQQHSHLPVLTCTSAVEEHDTRAEHTFAKHIPSVVIKAKKCDGQRRPLSFLCFNKIIRKTGPPHIVQGAHPPTKCTSVCAEKGGRRQHDATVGASRFKARLIMHVAVIRVCPSSSGSIPFEAYNLLIPLRGCLEKRKPFLPHLKQTRESIHHRLCHSVVTSGATTL